MAVIFINYYLYRDLYGNKTVIKISEITIHEPPFCDIEYNTQIKSNYSIGKWIPSTTEPFAECTYNSSQQTHCVLTKFGQQAKPQFLHRHREGLCPGRHPTRSRCHENSDSELGRVMESMRFEWNPTRCKLHPFNASKVVELQRKLHFIGDSLQTDMGNSMRCMLNNKTYHSLVTNVRFDTLGYEHGNDNDTTVMRKWNKIQSRLNIQPHDVVIMNMGAHWNKKSSSKIAFRMIANAVYNTVDSETIIFRTNVMGHKGCNQFTKPLDLDAMTVSNQYNWMDFDEINTMFITEFQNVFNANLKSLKKQFHALDISMFEMRGDGHVGGNDCLHYCTPSGINEWNKLLYHLLFKLEN
eukprot:426800_1